MPASQRRGSTRLRELLKEGRPLVVASAPGALYAQMMEQAGFVDCFFVGTNAVMGPLMGISDGEVSPSELVWITRWLARATSIPLMADMDSGFGGPRRIARIVEELIAGGVAGARIEDDSAAPSRPAWTDQVAGLAPLDECVARIRTAVITRDKFDPDFVISAKTDALVEHPDDLDGAIARLQAYKAAGADILHIHQPASIEQMAMARKKLEGPLTFTTSLKIDGALPAITSVEDHAKMGLAMAWYSDLLNRHMALSAFDYLDAIKKNGLGYYYDFHKKSRTHPFGLRSNGKVVNERLRELERAVWPESRKPSAKD